MSLPVHLVESLAGVWPGQVVTLEGDEAHHAVAVRRMVVGEEVVLTDGAGAAVRGEIAGTGKRRLAVAVLEVESIATPEPAITVVQALPKGDRGERAVEVLTEIGCARIVPWAAQRCVAVWRGDRIARGLTKWRATAREAAKQARRVWFPEVTQLAQTAAVVELVAGADLAVVLHEDGTRSWSSVPVPTAGSIVVVVGPEGGLTSDEIDALVAAGAVDVRLGAEVLRTSTAGLAAVAALLAQTSRWG